VTFERGGYSNASELPSYGMKKNPVQKVKEFEYSQPIVKPFSGIDIQSRWLPE